MPKKIRTGKVISNKMIGTITVSVPRIKVHPLYRKQYRVTKKYHADSAGQQFEIGQEITIEETKPMSKTKKWKVVDKNQKPK